MSPERHFEIERKYDVQGDEIVPELSNIGEGLTAGAPDTLPLEAQYFDTAGGALAERRIVLRKRLGGHDDGWHLKLPGKRARVELHWPATDELPDELLDEVRAVVRGERLQPIITMRTERTITRLHDATGRLAVEFADDSVTASSPLTGDERAWREWEVELGEAGDESLFEVIEERVRAAGGAPSASVSKLARALGRNSLETRTRTAPPKDGSASAGDAIVSAIAGLVETLVALDPQVRRDDEDALHQMRVTVRRVRAVLGAYRRVLDRQVTDPVRERLRELGTVLGRARDAEVMRDRLRALAGTEDVAFAVDLAQQEYDKQYAIAREFLSGEQYFGTLDALDALVADPPLTPAARKAGRKQLKRALEGECARVESRIGKANASKQAKDRDPAMHELRKAAKRLRYAVEAVTVGEGATLGGKVARLGRAAEQVQDDLGEWRDSLMLQTFLADAAGRAHEAGVNTFGWGVLYAGERERGEEAFADARQSIALLRKALG
jgi:CHAD domain-containing protein